MVGNGKTLSVVIPVYYNAKSLPELFAELGVFEKELDSRSLELELIFVNDGSGDDSLKQLLRIKKARPSTKIVDLSRNFGAIAASKTGFQFVTGDAFTILAADLQDPVEQVLLMVDNWLKGEKFIVSVREGREDPGSTKFFARIYYAVVRLLVVPNYPVGGYDLMLMDKAMLPHMATSGKHTNPNMYAFWLGFTPVKLPYHRRARRHGKSRWTFRKKLNFFMDTISGFSAAPIRLISAFGFVVALLSFAYGLNIIAQTLFDGSEVQGFATIVTLISFFSGTILVMLGIIGEYLWRTFEMVNNKPESVINQTYL